MPELLIHYLPASVAALTIPEAASYPPGYPWSVREDRGAADPLPGWQVLPSSEFAALKASFATFEAGLGQSVAPAPVPEAVSRRQLKEQLIRDGLIDQVEALLASVPGTEGRILRNWWAEANPFERANPLIETVGGLLTPPLSPAEIDNIFRAASAL